MQGVWGKRALSAMAAGYKRNWNNLRGAWGKREIPAAIAKGLIHFYSFVSQLLCQLSDVRVT